jgi:hypothetical protein
MNPPDQPTQPSETHKQLAADVFRMVHNRDLTAAAQLIADSEARAVAQLRSELNYAKASETLYHDEGTAAIAALTTEREKVRVLREALDEAQSCGGLTGSIFMQARAALAATEAKP